jgi:tetratricopeptide (TPR) repeat protein
MPSLAGPKYGKLFLEKLKLDLRHAPLSILAEQVKGSALRYVLVAALDHWADLTTDMKLLQRLLQVARQADSDPWRDQVRNVKTWQDLGQLQQLAKGLQPQEQTPQILALLARRLKWQGSKKDAVALMRVALVHYPPDFWLNFELGFLADDPAENAGCNRAALAIRPGSAAAHNNLGKALYDKKHLDGAIQEFHKAIELEPKATEPHNGLGLVLYARGDLEGAVQEFHKAINLDPKRAMSHNNLGNVLLRKGDLEGAIQEFHKAIELDSTFAPPHNGLGNALLDKKDPEGAIQEYHKAIDLDPKYAEPHNGLGNALLDKKDPEGAIQEYHKAISLDPKSPLPHSNLGNALLDKKDPEGAIQEYRKAIALDPEYAPSHYGLGNALRDKGVLEGAIQEYRKAIALDPKFVLSHQALGLVLVRKGDLEGAIQEFHKVNAVDPSFGKAYAALGQALLLQGRFAEAKQAVLQAVRLVPAGDPLHKLAPNKLLECDQLLRLDQRLAAIQQINAKPADAAEQLALAVLCREYKKQYAAAAEFYAAAFTAAPNLAADLSQPHRYKAAGAAALAAAGQGKDAGQLDAPAKAKLRQQALAWLQADLQAWKKLQQSSPLSAVTARNQLTRWQTDPDLAGVRDTQALAQLPEGERQDWQTLWADVAELLQQAKSKSGG